MISGILLWYFPGGTEENYSDGMMMDRGKNKVCTTGEEMNPGL
jgi:hypothetical protein